MQGGDQEENAVRRAVARVRLEEPIGQHAVLGHAVEHAVRADDRRVDRPGQDQEADHDDKSVEQDLGKIGAAHAHGQAADEIVLVLGQTQPLGNEQHGQEADAGRHDQAIDEDDKRRFLEVGQLRRLDLAIDLGESFFAAHGQDRMPEGYDQPDQADDAEPALGIAQRFRERGERGCDEPSRIFRLPGDLIDHFDLIAGLVHLVFGVRQFTLKVAESSRWGSTSYFLDSQASGGRSLISPRSPDRDRDAAPDQHDDHHDRGGDHDFESLVARFGNADEILAKEVERDGTGNDDRAPVLPEVRGGIVDVQAEESVKDFRIKPTTYCPAETLLMGPVST